MRSARRLNSGARAQVSMEFLLVITLVAAMTIPLVILFFNESQNAAEEISLAQASQITRRIVGAAEKVYALGEPTSVYLKVYIPPGVNRSSLLGREITLFVYQNGGLSEVSDVSSMNLSGSFGTGQGIHNIKVTAANGSVLVSEFSS